jgi:hypothetical protein
LVLAYRELKDRPSKEFERFIAVSMARSLQQVIAATIFVCFLIGFVAVLCIGNFFRAMRAMERQRQKRLARLSNGGGNGIVGVDRLPSTSPRSFVSSSTRSSEEIHLLSATAKLPELPRRRPIDDAFSPDLIQLDTRETSRTNILMSV